MVSCRFPLKPIQWNSLDSCASLASQSSHWLVVDTKTHGSFHHPALDSATKNLGSKNGWLETTSHCQPPIPSCDPQARALAAKGQTVTTLSLHHLSKRGTGELLCKGVCLKMQYTPEMDSDGHSNRDNDSAVDLVVPHFRETQLDRHFTSVLRHSHLHLNPGSMDGKSLKRTLAVLNHPKNQQDSCKL